MSAHNRIGARLPFLFASIAALGGIRHIAPRDMGVEVTDEESLRLDLFLAGLPDPNARQMWQRRIRRGLTAEQRQYVNDRLEELNEGT